MNSIHKNKILVVIYKKKLNAFCNPLGGFTSSWNYVCVENNIIADKSQVKTFVLCILFIWIINQDKHMVNKHKDNYNA